ncbi:MAG: hypothetical protein H9843_04980 [Candidatus Limosilactobacillus merdavium]|uniref:Uncharacterized protein n=1 Tax=Candidatus Limosilactobacillus merdavium TaxID=2838651 RepID=A0A9E2KUB6_9LACO|nr:hypothetical protein [Candidatus Limosilactobacillus merdavium]
MSGVISLTILLVIYAVSELISRKTNGIIDTVLTISILALVGFWTGILPKNLFTNSGVEAFGMAVVGLMLTSLGTTINLAELKRQWKVVLIAILGAIGSCILIVLVALLVNRKNFGIVGAPIFAGGNAATLVLLNALRAKNMQLLSTYALAVLTFQNLIGIPVATYALRKEARRYLGSGEMELAEKAQTQETPKRRPLQLPEIFDTPIINLAKLGVVASLSYGVSLLIHGTINYLVLCFIFGIIFYQLGFLSDSIMDKTSSSGMITFLVTIVILGSLANTTPRTVMAVLVPLLVCLVVGTIGVLVTAIISAKVFNVSREMAVALGMTCTFGFPTTMILSQEVASSTGQNSEEQTALENYLLPKMITAGLVTVTLVSVFFAGFAVNYL